jgi:hypothetical protein
MNIEEACMGLGLFLSKEKFETLREKIDRFSDDNYFIEYLGGLAKKDIHSVKIEDLLPIAGVLENIVFPNYPIDNPVKYSPLYKQGIKIDRINIFSKILEHLNIVSGIEKSIVERGISVNPHVGASIVGGLDTRLYIFSDTSYLSFMEVILNEHDKNSFEALHKKLSNFEVHINRLKQYGFNLEKMFSNDYAVLIRNINKNNPEFNSIAEGLAGLFKRFDELGFDMYHKQNLAKASLLM